MNICVSSLLLVCHNCLLDWLTDIFFVLSIWVCFKSRQQWNPFLSAERFASIHLAGHSCVLIPYIQSSVHVSIHISASLIVCMSVCLSAHAFTFFTARPGMHMLLHKYALNYIRTHANTPQTALSNITSQCVTFNLCTYTSIYSHTSIFHSVLSLYPLHILRRFLILSRWSTFCTSLHFPPLYDFFHSLIVYTAVDTPLSRSPPIPFITL